MNDNNLFESIINSKEINSSGSEEKIKKDIEEYIKDIKNFDDIFNF